MRNNGKSYGDISAALYITRQSARHLCKYEMKISKMKRGLKEKITGFNSYRVHREIQNIKKFKENVTTTNIIRNCNLDISKSTCWRTINRFGYKCRKTKHQILLTKKHKEARMKSITGWLTESTIGRKQFSVMKRDFFLTVLTAGTHIKVDEANIRQIRQCEGGGVSVWAMVMLNGLIRS